MGANLGSRIEGRETLPGRSNYLLGSDPSRWRTSVPHYARVVYDAIYPGISLAFYGNGPRLEHDFVVSPDADPSLIRVEYLGVERLEVDDAGDLILFTQAGELRQKKPLVYQEVDGERRELRGRYTLLV